MATLVIIVKMSGEEPSEPFKKVKKQLVVLEGKIDGMTSTSLEAAVSQLLIKFL